MKRLVWILFVSTCLQAVTPIPKPKVEKLTYFEKDILTEAQRKLEDAQENLDRTREQVMQSHMFVDGEYRMIDGKQCQTSVEFSDNEITESVECASGFNVTNHLESDGNYRIIVE